MHRSEALKRIRKLDDSFHEAGIFDQEALAYLIDQAGRRSVRHSAETGSGVSTLALSWLSANHTVFTLSHYGEIPNESFENVRDSQLLNGATTDFQLGPVQSTLPRYEFSHPLDLVVIDGPHGFPFPQLEYYYFYPQIAAGGLLVVDDIHIPTVRWLHEFLLDDEMFRLQCCIGNTSFFERTDSPTFNPLGDDWWKQGYNRKRFRDRRRLRDRAMKLLKR